MKMKNIRITGLLLVSVIIILSLSSCRRRPLNIMTNAVVVKLNNDYAEPYAKTKNTPYTYKVIFYDQETKEYVYEDFCGEQGGPVKGIPGRYTVYVHGLDNTTTLYRDIENMNSYRAYTEEEDIRIKTLFTKCQTALTTKAKMDGITLLSTKGSAGFEGDVIIKEPNAVFAGMNEDHTVPYLSVTDPDHIIPVDTEFAISQGTFTIYGITNTEYISGVRVFITNLARSKLIAIKEPEYVPVTECIPLRTINEEKIYGVFNYFGKLEGYGNTAYIIITDTSGGNYLFVSDISKQIQEQEDNAQIVVTLDYEIPSPEQGGGGFQPDVQQWDLVWYSVPIGKPAQ